MGLPKMITMPNLMFYFLLILFAAPLAAMDEEETKQFELDCALYRAIKFGNVKRVQKLLAAGAQLDDDTGVSYGKQPLMHAVKSGSIPTCELMLNLGADINEQNWCKESSGRWSSKRTALMQAAVDCRSSLCTFLLDAGADQFMVDEKNNSALLIVAEMHHSWSKRLKQPDCVMDPQLIEYLLALQETCKCLIDHQAKLQKRVLTLFACLKFTQLPGMHELYRRRNTFFLPYMKRYLVRTLLDVKNKDGKTARDYLG